MDQNTEVSLKSAGAIVEPKTVTFAFGKNWKNFLTIVDDDRIRRAENSLKYMLKKDTLAGITFLDAGCGSGLFSLAAARLEAKRVVSFDVDADSVQCARFLQEKYGPLPQWDITHGSVLDKDWLATLGKFDVVYSWGYYITQATCGGPWTISSLRWRRMARYSSASTMTRARFPGFGQQ